MPLSNCIIPIQAKLNELTQYGYTRQPVGALMAVLSAQNMSRVKPMLLSDDGKLKKYQITYVKPDCSAVLDCGNDGASRCDDGDSKPITTDTLTISDCTPSGVIELTDAQFRDLCNFGPNEFQSAQIMGKMDKVNRAINTKILTSICGGIGCFGIGNTDPRDIALINQSTGAPNWNADTEILSDFSDAGMNVTPLLVGGRTIRKYAKGTANGGVSDAGVNIGGMQAFPSFYDNQLQGVCGDAGKETFIAIAPGIVNFVSYLENVGQFQSNVKFSDVLASMRIGETFNYGTIQDPMTGLMWDLDVIFDTCTKTWKLSFRMQHDVWIMPITGCYGDSGSGSCFTGILKYNACQTSLACVTNG